MGLGPLGEGSPVSIPNTDVLELSFRNRRASGHLWASRNPPFGSEATVLRDCDGLSSHGLGLQG